MVSDEPTIVVKTLDNTPRILFWGADEFAILVAPIFLGIVLGSFLLMILGFVIRYFYKKYKRRYPSRFFKHKLYWILPKQAFEMCGILKNIPRSDDRDLIL